MPATPQLRLCTPDDAFALATIAAATLLDAFAGLVPGDSLLAHCRKNHNPGAYLAALAHPQARAWLAEVPPGAAPVGYAMLTPPDFPAALLQPDDLELRRIYLLSRFHGTGAGPGLMNLAITSAREGGARRLLLGVHPDNRRAIAFYTKSGFRQIGTREFHVGASTFVDPVFALNL